MADFRFRHLPVTSEADATANFEQLQPVVGELQEDSGWIVPTLENSWAKLSTPAVSYRKQQNVVRMRGQITGGANGSVALTLPEGYWPLQEVWQLGYASGVSESLIVIATSGTVAIFYAGEKGKEQTVLDAVNFTTD